MCSILEVGGEERFDFGGVDGFGAKDRITLLRITCEGKRNESGDDDSFSSCSVATTAAACFFLHPGRWRLRGCFRRIFKGPDGFSVDLHGPIVQVSTLIGLHRLTSLRE